MLTGMEQSIEKKSFLKNKQNFHETTASIYKNIDAYYILV
jgi:hypothetical protein